MRRYAIFIVINAAVGPLFASKVALARVGFQKAQKTAELVDAERCWGSGRRCGSAGTLRGMGRQCRKSVLRAWMR